MARAFQVHASDNVATLLEDTGQGAVTLLGAGGERSVAAASSIALGHKVAVARIPAGEAVVKYGVPIGRATEEIAAGQWVHLHNCRSEVDERSSHLDVTTGAAKDTPYA